MDAGLENYSKLLQLLVEAVPSASRIGYVTPRRLWDLAEHIVGDAASSLGVTLVPVMLDEPVDEEAVRHAYAALVDNQVDAYVRGPGQSAAQLQLFVDLALERRLPAIAPNPEFPGLGGLMSDGANGPDLTRRAGGYVARI